MVIINILIFLPLILIGLGLGGFGVYFFLIKGKDEPTEEEKTKMTAQEFINVKDIKECFLFTNDKKAFIYLEVAPISMEMMSSNEQKIFTKNITASLSAERLPFKTLSFPRPVDLSYLIFKYEAMFAVATSEIEKKLLSSELKKMHNLTFGNEASEFKFYFIFWDDENNTKDLLKRATNFVSNFDGTSIKINILSEKEIYRLCNLMNNPNYANFDDDEYSPTIPVLD